MIVLKKKYNILIFCGAPATLYNSSKSTGHGQGKAGQKIGGYKFINNKLYFIMKVRDMGGPPPAFFDEGEDMFNGV